MNTLKTILTYLPLLLTCACTPYMAVQVQVNKPVIDSLTDGGVNVELIFNSENGNSMFKVKALNKSAVPIKINWSNCIIIDSGVSKPFLPSNYNAISLSINNNYAPDKNNNFLIANNINKNYDSLNVLNNGNYFGATDNRLLLGQIETNNYNTFIAGNSYIFSPSILLFERGYLGNDYFDAIQDSTIKIGNTKYKYKTKNFTEVSSPRKASFVLVYSKLNDEKLYSKVYSFFINSIFLYKNADQYLMLNPVSNSLIFPVKYAHFY